MLLLVACIGQHVSAFAPESTVRPVLRGNATETQTPALTRPKARVVSPEGQNKAQDRVRPKLRPDTSGDVALEDPRPTRPELRPESAQDLAKAPASAPAPLSDSLLPVVRPKGLSERVVAERRAREEQRRRGAVCGVLAIQGKDAGRIPGKIAGCGIENAVRITSVSGVRLSQSSLMDCTTAKALRRWVDQGAKPAFGARGGGLSRLKVAAHYACRTRNSQPGARLSEHAKGRAIDISGFTLKDGTVITLLKGWGSSRDGKALRAMHRAACGPFGTVLGPESNRWHKDHFHFDTARYRSGSYCR